jgi:hypothetical protein
MAALYNRLDKILSPCASSLIMVSVSRPGGDACVAVLGDGDRLTGGRQGVHREEPSSRNTRVSVGDDKDLPN